MYIVPPELLQPGRPYAGFLRYLAENGYYGGGDVDALVARRVESLRNPSGKSFEDHAPDGRWFRILRRKVVAGGTVTVMTDVTEQKAAERDLLEATRRTEEANKLITEKNRMLEALYSELRDKNRQLEEQAAQIAEWNARLETRVTEQVAQIGQMSKLTRFLSPKVSDLIMSGDADDPLKTRRREITVVFVDLRGFTGFTETAEPEEVMSVLREYHAELGRAIMAYDGTIEHFAGDGVMILFNDPVPVENHELQAIRMALVMRVSVGALARGWKKRGYALGFGVGIAGGYATIGTIGFEGRLDYGAIGTVTNLAARLCGEAKDDQILISPRIFSKIEPHIETEPVGELSLKRIPPSGFRAQCPADPTRSFGIALCGLCSTVASRQRSDGGVRDVLRDLDFFRGLGESALQLMLSAAEAVSLTGPRTRCSFSGRARCASQCNHPAEGYRSSSRAWPRQLSSASAVSSAAFELRQLSLTRRGGVHFIRYLERGNYLGLDKEGTLVELGIAKELGVAAYEEKRPGLVISATFEFQKFHRRRDLSIAQSLFTHLNPADIRLCLSNLREFVGVDHRLYATFFEGDSSANRPRSHSLAGFQYSRAQMERFATETGWRSLYPGDWKNPRRLMMMRYDAV